MIANNHFLPNISYLALEFAMLTYPPFVKLQPASAEQKLFSLKEQQNNRTSRWINASRCQNSPPAS